MLSDACTSWEDYGRPEYPHTRSLSLKSCYKNVMSPHLLQPELLHYLSSTKDHQGSSTNVWRHTLYRLHVSNQEVSPNRSLRVVAHAVPGGLCVFCAFLRIVYIYIYIFIIYNIIYIYMGWVGVGY